MIVRPANGVLHLITQPDHAALAGRIMEHWPALQQAERRRSISHAIAQHDIGWQEPDARPVIDAATGRVHDFVTVPVDVRQSVWPRAIERLATNPWPAALVAQHAITVYDRYRSDPAWGDFFVRMTTLRDQLIAATSLTSHDLQEDYPFVRIGDFVSLIFCNRWDDEHRYAEWTFRLTDTAVVVSPDPFTGQEFPFEITAREIADRPYASDADLHDTIHDAPLVALRGTVRGT